MFYLVLPSDSSRRFFPHNTLTHYFTKLARPMRLDGDWEMGLVEIQYPHNWYNLHHRDAWFKFRLSADEEYRTLSLSSGFYVDGEKLVAEISSHIGKVNGAADRVRVTYSTLNHKTSVAVADGVSLELSPTLRRLLGFAASDRFHGSTRSSAVADLRQGFYSLYVYCDLAETRMVGDSMVPLLRVVNVAGDDGDMVCRTFDNVQYVAVQNKTFQEVEIDIRNDVGEPVPFERAKVVVTLHFRKKRPEL